MSKDTLPSKTLIQLDVDKLMSEPLKDVFQAITQLSKSQQEIIEAFYIMASIIDYPEEVEYHNRKMKLFLNKYSKEEVK